MKRKRSILSIGMASIMLVSLCAVYASTNVSAGPSSSRANAKATPNLTDSPIAAGTGPAACVLQGSTKMYVFVKGMTAPSGTGFGIRRHVIGQVDGPLSAGP